MRRLQYASYPSPFFSNDFLNNLILFSFSLQLCRLFSYFVWIEIDVVDELLLGLFVYDIFYSKRVVCGKNIVCVWWQQIRRTDHGPWNRWFLAALVVQVVLSRQSHTSTDFQHTQKKWFLFHWPQMYYYQKCDYLRRRFNLTHVVVVHTFFAEMRRV